jgi:thymidylate synthase (FAD)
MEINMNVDLVFISPKWLVMKGIRKCWKSDGLSDTDISTDTLGPQDKKLIKNIIKFGHTSTLEHSLVTFNVDGISRAVLQELSRHRVGVSPSVESTRYTMNKIINGNEEIDNVLVPCGDMFIDELNRSHMTQLKEYLNDYQKEHNKKLPNDIAKYGLVESYKVSEQISFNFRSLGHFFDLRRSNRALWEIRELADNMLAEIPEDYLLFFEDVI